MSVKKKNALEAEIRSLTRRKNGLGMEVEKLQQKVERLSAHLTNLQLQALASPKESNAKNVGGKELLAPFREPADRERMLEAITDYVIGRINKE